VEVEDNDKKRNDEKSKQLSSTARGLQAGFNILPIFTSKTGLQEVLLCDKWKG
jgi:hypothetical protein